VILGHAEASGQLTKDLERRNALAAFDARDVRGRAPGKRKLRLRQARPETRLAKPPTDRRRIVDVT
jgi:hypothetical protein